MLRATSCFLLLVTASASSADKTIKALQAQVTAQSSRVQALEAQLRSCAATSSKGSKAGKGTANQCSSLLDPEPEIAAFRAAEQERAAAKKQELLTSVFNVTVGTTITALAVSSSLLDNKNVPRVIAAADATGALHLFDRAGELAVTVPSASQTTADIISSIVIGPKEDPFVATGSLGGEVVLYNLSLPRIRTVPAAGGSASAPPPPPTTLKLAMRAPAQLDETGAPIPVLSMETYSRGRRTLLAVGDRSGAVRLLYRNGTQRTSVTAGGAVHAVVRNKEGVFVAVAAEGRGVLLYDMGKPSPTPLACDEGDDEPSSVVSLAWDVQLPQLLYAGTDLGEVRVYNSKARARQLGGKHGNESRMASVCKLVTSISGHEPTFTSLAPLKGYLFSAAGGLLAAHNVSGLYARTRDDPHVMLGRHLPASEARRGQSAAAALVASTRLSHVAVAAGATGEVQLLMSKLPFKDEQKEGGSFGFGSFGADGSNGGGPAWLLRNPIVLGVVMMLVFWQSSKMWKKDEGGGRGGAGLDPDVLRTLESMRASGGFGADFGDLKSGGRGLGGRSESRIEELDGK